MIFQWGPSLFLSKANEELQFEGREKEVIQKFTSKIWNQYSNNQKIGILKIFGQKDRGEDLLILKNII